MSKTIYHFALAKSGEEIEAKVVDAAFKSKWPDKYDNPQYSVKLDIKGEDHYFTTKHKPAADELGGYKGQTVTFSAPDNEILSIHGGGESKPAKGKVTSEEVKQKYTKKPSAAKEDYWSRKEERDIEWAKHQAEMQPKIMRQSARKDAVAFHALEVQSGKKEPSMERVEEIMKQMEKWVNEQEGTEW